MGIGEIVVDEIALEIAAVIAKCRRFHSVRKPRIVVLLKVPKVKMWVDERNVFHVVSLLSELRLPAGPAGAHSSQLLDGGKTREMTFWASGLSTLSAVTKGMTSARSWVTGAPVSALKTCWVPSMPWPTASWKKMPCMAPCLQQVDRRRASRRRP